MIRCFAVLVMMLFVGALTGCIAAAVSLVIGSGFLYALMVYSVSGTLTVLLLALMIHGSGLMRGMFDARQTTAAA